MYKRQLLFIVSLLPAAITVGDFPSIRASLSIPYYLIFISIGITSLKISRHKYFIPLLIIIALLQFINYWKIYLSYDKNYSQTWQYGYQQAIAVAKQNYNKYDQIVFSKKYGEAHEFVLFYWPWDPQKYQNDPKKVTDFHSDWYWVDGFDKFKFINDWEIKTKQFTPHTLLITSPNNYPLVNSKLIDTVKFLDGSPAFNIVSYE